MTVLNSRLLESSPGFAELLQNAQDFAPNYSSQSRKRHAVARRIIRHSCKNDLNSCQAVNDVELYANCMNCVLQTTFQRHAPSHVGKVFKSRRECQLDQRVSHFWLADFPRIQHRTQNRTQNRRDPRRTNFTSSLQATSGVKQISHNNSPWDQHSLVPEIVTLRKLLLNDRGSEESYDNICRNRRVSC